jgi:hypothetical protein
MPPKARADGLLVEHVGDEIVVYDLESKQAHCLAPLAAMVFSLSDGEATFTDIAAKAEQDLGQPVTERDVSAAVSQLEECALLDAPVVDAPLLVRDGLSRRQAISKVAFAGAAAAFGGSLITSIAAPSALAAAGSGKPEGCACSKNKDCASNHCCGDTGGGTAGPCNVGCCADNNGNQCTCSSGRCPSVATPPATCTACTGNPGSAC